MADQNFSRSYRSDEPKRPAANDPLAELARLIGQSDPFAEFARKDGQPQGREEPAASADWHADPNGRDQFDAPFDPFGGDAAAAASRGHDARDPAYEEAAHEGYADHGYAHQDYTDQPYSGAAAYEGAEHPADASGHGQDPTAAHAYAGEHRYAEDPHAPSAHDHTAYHGEQAGEGYAYDDHAGYDHPGYDHGAEESRFAPARSHSQDRIPDEPFGAPPPWASKGEGEEAYEPAPRARRRGGMLTAAAVLGLAVMGTAGAFTYRAISSGVGPRNPPIIRASTAPTKIVPTQTADASKSSDRVGDREQGERIVPQEEQPVNVQDAALPSAPRAALADPAVPSGAFPPGPPLPGSAPGMPSVLPTSVGSAAPAATPTGASGPKKVRTVSIPAEGSQASQGGAQSRGQAPSRTASAAPTGGDVTLPRGAASSRQPPAPAPAANAPLSLAPTDTGAPAPRSAPPTRTASAATGDAGAYAVQVLSLRSEAEAQAAYHALQHRFANLLGDREPVIRRADLGAKGIYYRAMVGGFATAEEAGHFCSSLKAAGGACLIQRN